MVSYYPAVHLMANQQLSQIKPLLEKYWQKLVEAKLPVEKLIVYGSYAKGIAKPYSDIDVSVIGKNFSFGNQPLILKLMAIAETVDDRIEPIPLSKEDFKDRFSALIDELKNTGITIK